VFRLQQAPYSIHVITFKAIAAMSLNRVIGGQGQIPWHLPEDFRWFKQTTMGHTLVMGRKTFESIGKALPGRETLVLTRGDFTAPGARTISDLSEIKSAESKTYFVCGGAQIYEQFLPICSELLLTTVNRVVQGDAFFPPFEDKFRQVEEIRATDEFSITRWIRF
jgi:dihydrofolate reductase